MNRLLTAAFVLFSLGAFAQYGKPQVIKPGDTVMIIRTPSETIAKLNADPDAKVRRMAALITDVETELELQRKAYHAGKIRTGNIQTLSANLGLLERSGVDIKPYKKEVFYYQSKR